MSFIMFDWFKEKSFLGIDISDCSIKISQICQRREVLFSGRALLDARVITDGKILSKEILAERLKMMLGGVLDHFPPAILGLPESRVFVHFFNVAGGIRGLALEKEVQDNAFRMIPADPKTLYWDYCVIQSKEEHNIFFVAVDKDILNGYLDVMRLAGIDLAAVEVGSGALARAMLRYPRSDAVAMIIDIGVSVTSISVFEGKNVPLLCVTVSVGGNHFTEAISKELKVSKSEADKLKRIFGFGRNQRSNKIFAVLEAEFENILKEVHSATAYYERIGSRRIGEIILAGGSALLPKIDEYMALKLRRPVKVGNPLKKIKKCVQLEKPGRAILCAGAIGLALHGINGWSDGINLLRRVDDKKYQTQRALKVAKPNVFN